MIPTFSKALEAFNKLHVKRTTKEMGIHLGVPEGYNKADSDLLITHNDETEAS